MLSTVVILLHSRIHANVGHLTNREVWRRTEPVTYIMVFKFGVDHKDQMLWQCDTLILIFENLPWKYLFFAIANSYLFLIFLFPHRNMILFTLPDKVWTRLRCFSASVLFLYFYHFLVCIYTLKICGIIWQRKNCHVGAQLTAYLTTHIMARSNQQNKETVNR